MKDRLLIITMILMISFSIHVFLYNSNNFAYALSCERINMTQSLDNADAVFFGKAISKEYVPNDRNNKHQDAVVQFSVIEAFKGVTEPKISVISQEWLWGFNFTKGAEYVVFADKNGEMLRVQDCAPTGTLDFIDIDQIRQEAQKHVTSPLQQYKSGIPIDEIQCKENLQLVIKASDGSPACVKSGNKAKLLERGWATKPIHESDRVEITGDDAWAICGALRLPCPSNPVFSGTLLDDNIIIKISGNGDPYEVKLNQTSVCVTSPSKQIECSKR